MSWLFASDGHIGPSALASVFPVNIQGWFPLGSTGFISLCPRNSPEFSLVPHFKSINSLALSLLCRPTLISIHDHWKNHSFDYMDNLSAMWCLCFLFIFFFELFVFLFFPLIFSFIFISWRLITLQYCSGFCHTLTRISNGFTCVPHPDPPSHLPPHPIFIAFFPRASIF